MVACELSLLLSLFLLGVYVIYTDLKTGIVRNTALGWTFGLGIVINIIYYSVFATAFFGVFLKNFLIVIILSCFLFFKHYWGGGDSKLLICLTLFIPGRLYDANESIPGLICLMIVFLLAYLYVIFDSIRGFIKGEHFTKGQSIQLEAVPQIIRDYLVLYMVIRLLNLLIIYFFPTYYYNNAMIIMLGNIMTILWLSDLKIIKNRVLICVLLLLTACSFIFFRGSMFLNWAQMIRNLLIFLMALLLRSFVGGYNYQEIKTAEVKKGMILSFATILAFNKSRVKGLPCSTTEDMRDRITEAQAEAIQRWGKSKAGSETIVIVKKMPFAIFLVLGTFIYVLIRVVL